MELDVMNEIHDQCRALLDSGCRADVCVVSIDHRDQFLRELSALAGGIPPVINPFIESVVIMHCPCPVLSGLTVRFAPNERCLAPIAVYQVEPLATKTS